jgi:hypothetical protein
MFAAKPIGKLPYHGPCLAAFACTAPMVTVLLCRGRCRECGGLVKPDIVFFGEPLGEAFYRRSQADLPQADLLLVMGTSLVVYPFAGIVGEACSLFQVTRLAAGQQRGIVPGRPAVGSCSTSLLEHPFASPVRVLLTVRSRVEGLHLPRNLVGFALGRPPAGHRQQPDGLLIRRPRR